MNQSTLLYLLEIYPVFSAKSMTIEASVFVNVNDFKKWIKNWNDEISSKKINIKDVIKKMDLINPCYIPRNHIIENALQNALNGDMSLIDELMQAL
ncbi:MAG: hypothetical protein ACJ0FN_01030 [Gammaproteobacteria bacterium]